MRNKQQKIADNGEETNQKDAVDKHVCQRSQWSLLSCPPTQLKNLINRSLPSYICTDTIKNLINKSRLSDVKCINPKKPKKQKKFEQGLGPASRAFLQHQKINIQLHQIARA